MKTKVSVDVRVDPSDKANWQAEAEAVGCSVSELVRQRMQQTGPCVQVLHPNALEARAAVEAGIAAESKLDLASAELHSLRSWLDLRDSDGIIDDELLAGWKGFAERHGVTFDDLLECVVVYANIEMLA